MRFSLVIHAYSISEKKKRQTYQKHVLFFPSFFIISFISPHIAVWVLFVWLRGESWLETVMVSSFVLVLWSLHTTGLFPFPTPIPWSYTVCFVFTTPFFFSFAVSLVTLLSLICEIREPAAILLLVAFLRLSLLFRSNLFFACLVHWTLFFFFLKVATSYETDSLEVWISWLRK